MTSEAQRRHDDLSQRLAAFLSWAEWLGPDGRRASEWIITREEAAFFAAELRAVREERDRLRDALLDARTWIARPSDLPSQHADTLIRATRNIDAALADTAVPDFIVDDGFDDAPGDNPP